MSSAMSRSATTLVRAPIVRQRQPQLTDNEWAAAEAMLSLAERDRLAELDARGAESFLAGRLLLRELAGELLGVDAAAVPLSASCIDCGRHHGCPRIDGSPLRLSLSHSATVVVAAAFWGSSVGIDVERITGSPERLDAIESLTGVRSLQHWTRVEAVLKADGRGLRVDPRRVHVVERGPRVHASVEGSRMRYRLLDLRDAGDAIGSLALEA